MARAATSEPAHRRRLASGLAVGLLVLAAIAGTLIRRGAGTDEPPSATDRILHTMAVAYAAGFRSELQLTTATSVAIAESSLELKARNWHPEYGYRPIGDQLGVSGPAEVRADDGRQLHSDRGIWQISSHWWPQYSDDRVDDPAEAAEIAFIISDGGRDFSPWDTFENGAAQAHFDRAVDGWPAVRPLVKEYLSSK